MCVRAQVAGVWGAAVPRLTVRGAIVALVALAGAVTARADDAPADLRAQLAAGEFAPARRAIEAAPADQRDAGLRQLAVAQAQAGQRDGALAAIGDIGDDQVRNQALGQMAEQPGGMGGLGGAPAPDFDSLIDLITATIEPESWDEVGGPGSIEQFPLGVYVDARGAVTRLVEPDADGHLEALREAFARPVANQDVRRASPLRKVSLPRLERAVQLRLAAGQPLDEEMRVLAGLQGIKHVLVYPETGDIVLAGPAGGWRTDAEGRLLGVESGHPVMLLDDLVVLVRQAREGRGAGFTCSITPLVESLAAVKTFLAESAKKPLRPGAAARNKWLKQVRDTLGPQTVEYEGIDPGTRVARVMFEADYRMKLVGIGLEEGTLDVPSYLAMVDVPAGQSPPPLGVLRWWFALDFQSIVAGPRRDVFELRGQGVKVLSENQMLDVRGIRHGTGEADELNQAFAQNFTRHFRQIAQRYPVYADLQNICHLALVAALIQSEDLPARVGWHMTCFGDPAQYQVAIEHAPASVETVINHRMLNQKQILAAASGGVDISSAAYVGGSAIRVEKGNRLDSEYQRGAPVGQPRDSWWWD
jgi:hypothetical protein